MKAAPQILQANSTRGDLRALPGVASCLASQRRRAQGGYVLLGLLFMTSVLAISLALTLPRAAMQAQRVREERLIYRGEQYKRAVQLYFRKYKKYPSSIDDLEDTNGQRFLRRRYKDPITGKDEWRLVHMGNDGRFSDSLIRDKAEAETGPIGVGGSQPSAPIGSAAAQATDASMFVSQDGRLRGADRARAQRYSAAPDIPGQAGSGSGPAFLPNGQNAAQGDPAQQPDPNDPYAVTGAGPSGEPAGTPVQPQPGQYPGYSRVPTRLVPNQGQVLPAAPAPFGVPQQQQAAQTPQYRIGNPTPVGNAPGAQPQAGMRPAAFGTQGVGNQATQIISNLLTRPRPGGLSGIVPGQAQQQQSAFGGGLAGVASEAEDRGVKVYQGFEQYNQWEFVYDYRQDRSLGGAPVGPQPAAPAGGQGLQAGQPGLGASGGLTVTPGSIPGIPGGVPYQPAQGTPSYPIPPSTFGQPGAGGQSATPSAPSQIDPVTGQPIEQPTDPNQQDPNQQGNYPQDQPAPAAPNGQQPNIRGFPPGAFPFPGQGNQQQRK
jgi:type II secretory pathway pseudopilin PulG